MEFESASHIATSTVASAPNSAQGNNNARSQALAQPAGTTTIEFKGQMLNLDLDNVFSRFSQV